MLTTVVTQSQTFMNVLDVGLGSGGVNLMSCCLSGRVRLRPLKRVPYYLLQYYGDPEFRWYVRAYNQVFTFTSTGVARSDGVVIQRAREDTSVQGQHGTESKVIWGILWAPFYHMWSKMEMS